MERYRAGVRIAWITGLLAACSAVAAAQSATGASAAPTESPFGFAVFAQFGYERFAAEKSFDAVLGKAGGGVIGGGGEVRFAGAFVHASIERFTATGQRVAIVDDEIFKLGVPDTVTVTPLSVAAGWRFRHDHATPYLGAGVGRILFTESSPFTEASENLEARSASYHVLGGVEFRNGWVATAFEVQWTRAPNALGIGGASAAFHESNLGGISGRVKVLVGR